MPIRPENRATRSVEQSHRPHGTRAKYVVERCHCPPCRAANRNYSRHRSRQLAYGRSNLVNPTPARAHLQVLRESGVGLRPLAELTGIARSALRNITNGTSSLILLATEQKILAVTPDAELLAGAVRVTATGTHRRLQALVAIGWSQAKLARLLGKRPDNFTHLLHSDKVHAATARAVADLYERIWNTAPPSDTHSDRIACSRAVRYAAARGWAPPLGWDDIDDETQHPHHDLAPADASPRRRGIDLDEVAWLESFGIHIEQIADRFGVTVGAIERARTRALRDTA